MKEAFEKIIKRLEELKAEKEIGSHKVMIKESIEIVNQVAEEYGSDINVGSNDSWIPCSERLPEAGTHRDVWISIENEAVAYRANWYLDHFEWENGWVIKEPILAWMPNDVPEVYQPKGEK